MDTNKILNLTLRLTIWFLLTADFSIANILIGALTALFIPHSKTKAVKFKDWLQTFWKIIKAIPQAYFEAIQIMLSPHDQEDFTQKKVPPGRPLGLVFLDIFLITFTPKTIVSNYEEKGRYEIHRIKRK